MNWALMHPSTIPKGAFTIKFSSSLQIPLCELDEFVSLCEYLRLISSLISLQDLKQHYLTAAKQHIINVVKNIPDLSNFVVCSEILLTAWRCSEYHTSIAK